MFRRGEGNTGPCRFPCRCPTTPFVVIDGRQGFADARVRHKFLQRVEWFVERMTFDTSVVCPHRFVEIRGANTHPVGQIKHVGGVAVPQEIASLRAGNVVGSEYAGQKGPLRPHVSSILAVHDHRHSRQRRHLGAP